MNNELAMGIRAYWQRSEVRKDWRASSINHTRIYITYVRKYGEQKRLYREQKHMYQQVVERIEELCKYSALLPPKKKYTRDTVPYRKWDVTRRPKAFEDLHVNIHFSLLDWIEINARSIESLVRFELYTKDKKLFYQFTKKEAFLCQSQEDLVRMIATQMIQMLKKELSDEIQRDH